MAFFSECRYVCPECVSIVPNAFFICPNGRVLTLSRLRFVVVPTARRGEVLVVGGQRRPPLGLEKSGGVRLTVPKFTCVE